MEMGSKNILSVCRTKNIQLKATSSIEMRAVLRRVCYRVDTKVVENGEKGERGDMKCWW